MQMTRKRIRLLQLVHAYPPAVGGVEFSTRDLCEALVANYDLDVTVFTTNAFTVANFVDGSLPTIPIDPGEEQNGVRIRRFPFSTRGAPALRQLQRVAWHLKLPGNDRLRTWYQGPIAPDMLRAVRGFDADGICAASFPLNHMTYPFRRAEPRPPIVLVPAVHTTNAWGFLRPHLIELAARAYATVAHTEHEREWLIAHGAPVDRVRVIGHGIELADFKPDAGRFRSAHSIPPGALVVAYVGQQAGHKGIDTLLRVLPQLLERRPDARLVVAGARTPYSLELRRIAGALPEHARSRLLLMDDVTSSERAEVLVDCDIFASPSEQEAFGITTLEAWSQGKPVIVGDGPAQACVVDHEVTGLLVPYGDERRLLQTLVELADDEGLRFRLGEAGHRRLHEHHLHSEIVARYHELFVTASTREAG
jgi:glycosyltransferase involved in cell wall biosynthesis